MIRNRSIILLTILSLSICLPGNALTPEEQEQGFVSMFNGEDLSGWKTMGNEDAFVVEDSVIAVHPNRGNYLRYHKQFEDFILRLEYKVAPKANSGIFFHAPEHGRNSRVGFEVQLRDTHGQDPSPHITAALYDAVAPKINNEKPAGEWNDLELLCQWPVIRITLNGKEVMDINAEEIEQIKWRRRFGWLGLQDHHTKAWFRNLRIKDLGGDARDQWTPLFNGKNFDGWRIIGDATWTVEDEKIVAKDGNGYLITEEKYKNFHLWTYVKTTRRANGGIFYRWNKLGDRGHEAQIYNVEGAKNPTGSIYNRTPASGLYASDFSWFPMQVIAQGKHSKVIVNGKIVAEYDETVDREGHISLQMHRKDSTIQFKDLRIFSLEKKE